MCRAMPLVTLRDLPPKGVLIGLDPGTRTLGLAASDASRRIASPVETIVKDKLAPALERLFEVYRARGAVGLVAGLPLNTDGSQGRRVQSVRTLVSNLLKVEDIPVAFQDERFSTEAAIEALGESRGRTKASLDAAAAAVILQAALDQLERPA
jgi:putative holliday junction resolvase